MISRADIQKAVSELSEEELSRFRAWFRAFEAERYADDSTATKLGRFAGKLAAELRKGRKPQS
jgi:hypothetical protein